MQGANVECLSSTLFPLLMDTCAENLAEITSLTLQPMFANNSDGLLLTKTYQHILGKIYSVLLDGGKFQKVYFSEKILQVIVNTLDAMLDDKSGRKALEEFLTARPEFELIQILLTIGGSSDLSPEYASKVLKLFNKLFEISEKNPKDTSIVKLCSSLARLAEIPSTQLDNWLRHLVRGQLDNANQALDKDQLLAIHDNRLLLHSLSRYLVQDESPVPEEVAQTILKCLIPMADYALSPTSEGLGFEDLMTVMNTLAGKSKIFSSVILFWAILKI